MRAGHLCDGKHPVAHSFGFSAIVLQQMPRDRAADAHLRAQEGLALQQALLVAAEGNARRPVVGQEHVQGPAQLHQAEHLQLAYVVRALQRAAVVRRAPHVWLQSTVPVSGAGSKPVMLLLCCPHVSYPALDEKPLVRCDLQQAVGRNTSSSRMWYAPFKALPWSGGPLTTCGCTSSECVSWAGDRMSAEAVRAGQLRPCTCMHSQDRCCRAAPTLQQLCNNIHLPCTRPRQSASSSCTPDKMSGSLYLHDHHSARRSKS